MSLPQNVKVENVVKFGLFAPQVWVSKLVRMKFGMEAYTIAILLHASFGPDWCQGRCRNPPPSKNSTFGQHRGSSLHRSENLYRLRLNLTWYNTLWIHSCTPTLASIGKGQLALPSVLWHGWAAGRASSLYKWGDGGGGHWLVRLEWRPAGWSLCLPLLIFSCTIKCRSSLLAPAHTGGPGKTAVKWLWWWWWQREVGTGAPTIQNFVRVTWYFRGLLPCSGPCEIWHWRANFRKLLIQFCRFEV